ncbi:hypothetical protein THAOC_02043 [Thalassiosira oceanica]|uniref:Uncharacterized protein n=1 Tax=Thalassiosira oceanica TaxID=159749 RepID=K0TGV2_THAOC|nr:hypothetical protein THAOC_02043 [Thalassiosira oceanica]|eukprot:EJK76209.1 hypothetical protein THAOC_02043 [Thalassiosira oceanica]
MMDTPAPLRVLPPFPCHRRIVVHLASPSKSPHLLLFARLTLLLVTFAGWHTAAGAWIDGGGAPRPWLRLRCAAACMDTRRTATGHKKLKPLHHSNPSTSISSRLYKQVHRCSEDRHQQHTSSSSVERTPPAGSTSHTFI